MAEEFRFAMVVDSIVNLDVLVHKTLLNKEFSHITWNK